jgi:hypothetical protein
MSLETKLEKHFDERLDQIFDTEKGSITRNFKGRNAYVFIKQHERKKLCIENVAKQIREIELREAIGMDDSRIATLGGYAADLFCKVALSNAEQLTLSNEEKKERIRKNKEDHEYTQMLNEELTIVDKSEEL